MQHHPARGPVVLGVECRTVLYILKRTLKSILSANNGLPTSTESNAMNEASRRYVFLGGLLAVVGIVLAVIAIVVVKTDSTEAHSGANYEQFAKDWVSITKEGAVPTGANMEGFSRAADDLCWTLEKRGDVLTAATFNAEMPGVGPFEAIELVDSLKENVCQHL